MLQADRSAESAGRLENLNELTRAMEEYETLGAFLEHVSLVMDNDALASDEKVTIMTIHAAKGLEFERVRSEEHTSELQSLMRISYAVFCLQKKKQTQKITKQQPTPQA